MSFDVNYPLVHFGYFVSPICFFVQQKKDVYIIFIYYSGRSSNLLAEYVTVSYEMLKTIIASFVYSFEGEPGSRGHFIFSIGDFQVLPQDEIRQHQRYKHLISWEEKTPLSYDDIIPLIHAALKDILKKAECSLGTKEYKNFQGKQREYRLRCS